MTCLKRVEVGGRLVGAVLADRALGPADAGRVDEHAHRAHRLGHLDGVDDVVGVRDVDLGERAADLVGELLALVLLQVGDDDLGARAASSRADAAPIPEAPPVTIALAPVMSMPRTLGEARRALTTGRVAGRLRPASLHLRERRPAATPPPPAPSPPGAGTRGRASTCRCGRPAPGRPRASTTPASGRRACARATSTAATPTRPCGRSRTPSPTSRAPRTPWPSGPAWAPSPRPSSPCARPATTSSSSARSTPARWRSCRAPCARFGIEHTVVDGTVPGAFAAAVRPGRTMLVIAESPSNPRLDLVDLDDLGAVSGPFTVARLDVRHADRPAAAAPRRRPRPALGDEGHLRPQRRHARRRRRRARPARRDLVLRRAARRHAVALRCAQRAARHPHARRPPAPPGRRRPARRRAPGPPSRRRRRAPPRPARPPAARAGDRPAALPADGASPSTSPAASTPPAR